MKKLIVANWKMQMSANQERSWIDSELPSVLNACSTAGNDLIVCPSFTTLSYATESFPESLWGAQTCGFAELGPYTGDISVVSLEELGVRYCLVGHSEQRKYHGETDDQCTKKTALLGKYGLTPIICIGEKENANRDTVLTEQLSSILSLPNLASLIIAYEPLWSIGTGEVPSKEALRRSVALIRALCAKQPIKILYGGSVTEKEAALFCEEVDGFLIGKASIHAELLKKIILSC